MFRPATTTDAQAIAEVHVQTWQVAYRDIVPDAYLQSLSIDKREEAWRLSLERGFPEVWVAEVNSRVVGWVAFGPSRDDDASPEAGEIEAIYLLPDYWSSGIGRGLWLKAQHRLIERGFTFITLWVLTANVRAIDFYRAAGFSPNHASEKKIYIGGTVLNEIRYEMAVS